MGLYQAVCPQCQKEHLWFSGISDQRCEACKNPFAPTPQQPLDDCTKAKLGLFDPAKPVPGQQKQSPIPAASDVTNWACAICGGSGQYPKGSVHMCPPTLTACERVSYAQEQPGPREWWALLENDPGSHEYGRVNEYEFNIPGSFKVVEKSALTAMEQRLAFACERLEVREKELDACEAKLAEAVARPATFIKMDETTEAFQQTHAAIANMQMFQKDTILLRHQLQAEREKTLIAEEDVRFYRNEFENACERVSYAQEQLQTERERADKCETAMNAAHESLKWSKEYDGKILQERDRYKAALERIAIYAVTFEADGFAALNMSEIAKAALAGEGKDETK